MTFLLILHLTRLYTRYLDDTMHGVLTLWSLMNAAITPSNAQISTEFHLQTLSLCYHSHASFSKYKSTVNISLAKNLGTSHKYLTIHGLIILSVMNEVKIQSADGCNVGYIESLLVCLHRAGHWSRTKLWILLSSLSVHWQWRSFFHHLLTVDRRTDGIMILSTGIYVHHWPVGQPSVNHV